VANTVGKMLQAELDEFLGYEWYERSENPNYRNGSYPRKFQTPYGEIDCQCQKITT
jgi:transposase-like protein